MSTNSIGVLQWPKIKAFVGKHRGYMVAVVVTIVVMGLAALLWHMYIIPWEEFWLVILVVPAFLWLLWGLVALKSYLGSKVQKMQEAGNVDSTSKAKLAWVGTIAGWAFSITFRKAGVFWVWLLLLTNFYVGVWFGGYVPALNKDWMLPIVWLWPLIIRLGFYIHAKGWHRGRFSPVRLLGFSWGVGGERSWRINVPYWGLVSGLAAWQFWKAYQANLAGFGWRTGFVIAVLMLWGAYFLWSSAKRVKYRLPEKHTLDGGIGRPHMVGFIPLLFKVGLFPPSGKAKGKKDEEGNPFGRLLSTLRFFFGIGPIAWVLVTFIMTRFWPGLLLQEIWIALLVVLSLYWLLWGLFGFPKILYVSTKGPDGETKSGVFQVILPRLTLFGIVYGWEEIPRGGKTCKVTPAVGDRIVHIDPGMELKLMAEESVKFWYVDREKTTFKW